MTLSDKLQEELAKTGWRDFTLKQLYKKMNIRSAFERDAISDALAGLVEGGVLVEYEDDKYAYPDAVSVIKGVLRGNRRGFAFLVREDGGADMFVPHKSLRGAMHGDTVYVRPVKSESGDEAAVVRVVKRGFTELVGTFEQSRQGFGFVVPDEDGYFEDIFIPAQATKGLRTGLKVVAKITEFNDRGPVGEIIEVLGREGTVKGDMLSIIRAEKFREKFPPEVLDEAERVAALDILREAARRRDFRKLLTITIDGDDARDFDDAISVERTGSGYRLYVHIADVSNYVKGGSVLDKEAVLRATSVYLPNMVLPMLPEALSNGCCSLVEGEDRLTLSAVMDIDEEGKLTAQELCESVICSNHRMTYGNVTKILTGDAELIEEYKDIHDMLLLSSELAEKLRGLRHKRGSIDFVTKESKFILDGDNVLDVMPYPYDESNSIIEEFMLMANATVAEYMYHTDLPFVYRVHESPSAEKLEMFSKFVSGCGYKFPIRSNMYSMQFQQLLEELKGTDVEAIVSKVMLRSMQKAKYSTVNDGHFGLALEYYCHFTSPIRRYPDLMIHRVIKAMLRGDITEKYVGFLEEQCNIAAVVSSERERAADMCERNADDYFKALYMRDKIGEVYSGYVSGVTNFGVFVELDNTVEGLIPKERLPRDSYVFDAQSYTIKGTKNKFTLGNRLTIMVVGVSIEDKRVEFVIYEEKR